MLNKEISTITETSLLKFIMPHCARSKNTISVGTMTALTLVNVSELRAILYLSGGGGGGILLNGGGLYFCAHRGFP